MSLPQSLTLEVLNNQGDQIANDGYSNDATPELQITWVSGSVSVGDVIDFYDGTTLLKSVKLTAADITNGSINYTVPKQADGSNDFSATLLQKTTGTEIGISNSSVDNIDTQKPIISDIEIDGGTILTGAEARAGFTVTGTVSDTGNDIAGQTVIVNLKNGNSVVATEYATVQANGTWSTTFNGDFQYLTKSLDSITAQVTDQAGNTSPVATQYFDYVICFMPGTMLKAPEGEVAVETLKIGDPVLTADGRVAAVRWIGRQTVSTIFGDPLRILPIRIKAGAIEENVPSRDLLLSPDHAVLVDGALIQAGSLVNGSSIVREENVPRKFTYYHVELENHELILAENTPAETFIDNVDRMAFDNWSEHEALYPDLAPLIEMPYPRAKAHRQVPKITRQRLAARAAAIGTDVVAA